MCENFWPKKTTGGCTYDADCIVANQFCDLGKNECECKAGFSTSANGDCKLGAVLGTPLADKKIGVLYFKLTCPLNRKGFNLRNSFEPSSNPLEVTK